MRIILIFVSLLLILWFILLFLVIKIAVISKSFYQYLQANFNDIFISLTIYNADDINMVSPIKVIRWIFNDEKYNDLKIYNTKLKLKDGYRRIFILAAIFLTILTITIIWGLYLNATK